MDWGVCLLGLWCGRRDGSNDVFLTSDSIFIFLNPILLLLKKILFILYISTII